MNNLILIDLDRNLLETLASYSFFNLTKIQLISLRNNRLKSIQAFSFFLLNQVNSFIDFYLNFNLSEISFNSFNEISKTHFSYENSFLQLSKSYTFNYFTFDTLNLAKNNIQTLSGGSIKGTFVYLILDANLLSQFEANSFGYMPNLKEISFLRNRISKLNFHQAFQYQLDSLQKLDFKFNKINSIVEFFFKFPNLVHLDLSFNNFYDLRRVYLLNLFNLKWLSLGNNQILTIETETFNQMINLIYLDLSQNLIYDLAPDLFEKLINLKELKLSGNKLETVKNVYFNNLVSIDSLELSSNLFKNFTLFTFGLKSLKFSSNSIEKWNFSDSTLEYLDLSFNNLETFKNSYENLTYLDLSHNPKLSFISSLGSLKVLNLSNTNTNLILNLSLSSSIGNILEEIDFSFNDLSSLSLEHFSNFKSLKFLNLRETKLINFQFLNHFEENILVSIDLSGNTEFRGSSSVYLKRFPNSLKHLELSKLNLNSFDSSLYFSYEYIDLSFNKLSVLNDIFTFKVFNLTHLDLSYNSFEMIFATESDFKWFRDNFPKLKVINLTRSLTDRLSNTVFHFNRLIEIAHLSNNYLNFMPKFCQVCWQCINNLEVSLNVECKLKQVYLDSNNLTIISYSDLIELNNLEYLNLERN